MSEGPDGKPGRQGDDGAGDSRGSSGAGPEVKAQLYLGATRAQSIL